MKQITDEEKKLSHEPHKPLPPAIVETLNKYGSANEFMLTFNKDIQTKVAANTERAYLGTAPSLHIIRQAYSDEVLNIWIVAQLEDVNNFTNIKQKMSFEQMQQTALVIATEYAFLKASEFHLFLHRFKAGQYGTFYGCIDPLQITYSLAQFIEQRRAEITKIEQKQNLKQIFDHQQLWAKEAVSREEYEELKKNKDYETRK